MGYPVSADYGRDYVHTPKVANLAKSATRSREKPGTRRLQRREALLEVPEQVVRERDRALRQAHAHEHEGVAPAAQSLPKCVPKVHQFQPAAKKENVNDCQKLLSSLAGVGPFLYCIGASTSQYLGSILAKLRYPRMTTISSTVRSLIEIDQVLKC